MRSEDILDIIIAVYQDTAVGNIEGNKQRSATLLSNIASGISHYYNDAGAKNIVVFERSKRNERFKISEFLFDIHVCEYAECLSKKHSAPIPYLEKSIMQLESEFEQDSRESLKDLSKLVCGKCDMKVMILPLSKNMENYLDPISQVWHKQDEILYVIFLPHPEKWDHPNAVNEYSIYKCKNGKFEDS